MIFKKYGFEVLVVMLVVFALVFAAFLMGRDLNWDFFNYHDYAANFLYGDRLSKDYFAAGYQGYLNPLPYFIYGFLVESGYDSAKISMFLAFVHSLNAVFVFFIARDILIATGYKSKFLISVVFLLTVSTNVFLSQLGSTFVDPVTTVPVMAAVYILISWKRFYWLAFILLGLAVGLKLTNIIYFAGCGVAWFVTLKEKNILSRINVSFIGFASGLVGFLLSYGWWGYRLHKEYDSPFFPLFNSFFKSIFFYDYSLGFHRFVPAGLSDALWRMFEMAEISSWIYVESIAPDLRPALFVILLVFSLILAVLKFSRIRHRYIEASFQFSPQAQEVILFCIVFFMISLLLWFVTSGNGRYGLPLFLMYGVMIFLLLIIFKIKEGPLKCLLFVLLSLQVFHIQSAGNPRWNPMQWSDEWLPVDLPEYFSEKPAVFVSVGTSSESYLVRHMHKDSSFTNPIGLISIPDKGAMRRKFDALFDGREIYVLFRLRNDFSQTAMIDELSKKSGYVKRLGIAVDVESCDKVTVNDFNFQSPLVSSLKAPPSRFLAVCASKKINADSDNQFRDYVSNIINSYALKCPKIFAPHPGVVEGDGNYWSVMYGKHDLIVGVLRKSGDIFMYQERQPVDTVIGNIETWRSDLEVFDCKLPFNGSRRLQVVPR